MKIYLSNPYGTIPGENWREYRFFLLATSLAEKGHDVVWFTSTFSHHFKIQRSVDWKGTKINNDKNVFYFYHPPIIRNLRPFFIIRQWSFLLFFNSFSQGYCYYNG